MPPIKIDFYQVHIPDGDSRTFEDLLNELMARSIAQRTISVADGWLHLYDLNQSGRHIRGIILRAKDDEIPPAADRAGAIEDLRLNENQGLAGLTYFLYHPRNRVLLLHRNPHGVSAPRFENYLMQTTDAEVEFRPIVQREVIRKLKRMQTLRKIDIKLANPGTSEHFRAGRSVESLIDLMHGFEAPYAEVILSMGYQRGTLNIGPVVRTLERLFRLFEQGQAVQKIVAVGKRNEEERSLVLDLLHDKIVETAEVHVGENRRLSDSSCKQALEDAWNRRRQEVEELLGR